MLNFNFKSFRVLDQLPSALWLLFLSWNRLLVARHGSHLLFWPRSFDSTTRSASLKFRSVGSSGWKLLFSKEVWLSRFERFCNLIWPLFLRTLSGSGCILAIPISSRISYRWASSNKLRLGCWFWSTGRNLHFLTEIFHNAFHHHFVVCIEYVYTLVDDAILHLSMTLSFDILNPRWNL